MSAKLFSLFVRSSNLPRNITTGIKFRHIAALNMATVDSKTIEEKPQPEIGLKPQPEIGLKPQPEIGLKSQPEIVLNKNLTRFKKRGKRNWDEPNPRAKENGESDAKKTCERIKRKKMAMLLGYSGVDYHGMQRNPGVPTIEEDLLKALLEAKYITEEDFANQQNAQFQRSSRTDKGVSAARQVVSLKLPLESNIDEINKRLPECIKVFGIKRVTNKFNSKGKCNARTYSYTLPTYVFEPSLVTEEERKKYRIPEEKLQRINEVLGAYKGTKSYHNFTEKKHHQDPSALRYMMGFDVERVFVHTEMEFAVLLVKGQSFLLHQIRKMVGLALAVVRGNAEASIMERAFGKDKVMIPTAPGLGLVLDKVHYERYDAKFKDSHESLSWDEVEPAVQQFKQEHINPSIVRGELQGSMAAWLEKLATHSYEPSEDRPQEETGEQCTGGDDEDDDSVSQLESNQSDAKADECVISTDAKNSYLSDTDANKSDDVISSDTIKSNDIISSDAIKSDDIISSDAIKSSDVIKSDVTISDDSKRKE